VTTQSWCLQCLVPNAESRAVEFALIIFIPSFINPDQNFVVMFVVANIKAPCAAPGVVPVERDDGGGVQDP